MLTDQILRLHALLMGIPICGADSVVEAALELLKLGNVQHMEIRFLSGGTKRRLQLGMAMIGDPRLLILVRCL